MKRWKTLIVLVISFLLLICPFALADSPKVKGMYVGMDKTTGLQTLGKVLGKTPAKYPFNPIFCGKESYGENQLVIEIDDTDKICGIYAQWQILYNVRGMETDSFIKQFSGHWKIPYYEFKRSTKYSTVTNEWKSRWTYSSSKGYKVRIDKYDMTIEKAVTKVGF